MSRGVASSSLRRRSRRPGRTACPTLSLPSSGSTGPISNSPALSRGGIPLEVSPELRDAGERAFAVIRSAAERLVAQIPAAQRPPAFMVALHRCSAAAMPEGGSCQCRRRNSWRPACWFISAGSDFPKAAPFRDDPGAVRGGKAERIPCVGRPFRATRVTCRRAS